MEYNIYRMIGGDYTQSRGIQLPITSEFIEKIIDDNGKTISKGQKRIVYVKGSNSIFLEDKVGDMKPEQVWFKFGDLRVDKNDHILNEIAQKHSWYGKRYVLWTQDTEDKTKLEELRFKGAARKLIEEADLEKVKAIALAVFGYSAISWSDEKCELKLREYADTKPKKLQEVMNDGDYEAKLLAGHAFVQDIVKENTGKTAVIWSKSDGVILKLAKGEKGITELGRYLATRTDESEMVLQSIAQRIEKIVTDTVAPDKDEIISAKDKEIAKLKAQLAATKPSQNGQEQPNEASDELIEARKKYEETFKNKVPRNMKNNLDWINNRLGQS